MDPEEDPNGSLDTLEKLRFFLATAAALVPLAGEFFFELDLLWLRVTLWCAAALVASQEALETARLGRDATVPWVRTVAFFALALLFLFPLLLP